MQLIFWSPRLSDWLTEIHIIGSIWHGVISEKGFPTIYRQVSYQNLKEMIRSFLLSVYFLIALICRSKVHLQFGFIIVYTDRFRSTFSNQLVYYKYCLGELFEYFDKRLYLHAFHTQNKAAKYDYTILTCILHNYYILCIFSFNTFVCFYLSHFISRRLIEYVAFLLLRQKFRW